jgi:hypothetical protein
MGQGVWRVTEAAAREQMLRYLRRNETLLAFTAAQEAAAPGGEPPLHLFGSTGQLWLGLTPIRLITLSAGGPSSVLLHEFSRLDVTRKLTTRLLVWEVSDQSEPGAAKISRQFADAISAIRVNDAGPAAFEPKQTTARIAAATPTGMPMDLVSTDNCEYRCAACGTQCGARAISQLPWNRGELLDSHTDTCPGCLRTIDGVAPGGPPAPATKRVLLRGGPERWNGTTMVIATSHIINGNTLAFGTPENGGDGLHLSEYVDTGEHEEADGEDTCVFTFRS